MYVKKIAIGNTKEAFVENRLTSGFNILFSDDNNRGKTIVIQAMMYALGNEPIFPATFDYKDYYFYLEIEHNDDIIHICRKKNNYVINDSKKLFIFDNTGEYKRYWNENIHELPKIIKDGGRKLVDPVLYLQLMFIGQDNKSTSNISNRGYYNKTDFMNMMYSIGGATQESLSADEIKRLKVERDNLKTEAEDLLKQHKILTSRKPYVSYFSNVNERLNFENTIEEMEKVHDKITELKKDKNAFLNRKLKWNSTLKEIKSLNRNIQTGELACMDCGSTNIHFSSSDHSSFSFDVSTKEMRDQISESIKQKIETYEEEIQRLDINIQNQNSKLNELMNVDDVSLVTLLAHKDEFKNIEDIDSQIVENQNEIKRIEDKLKSAKLKDTAQEELKEAIESSIVRKIEKVYSEIDPDHQIEKFQIFTPTTKQLSGSEGTIFHLARIYAFQDFFKHDMPIVIDSFRAEDLSSDKEDRVLKIFSSLPNQKIFTTTLKKEEENKYSKYMNINDIDYSDFEPYKLLQESYLKEFKELLDEVKINF